MTPSLPEVPESTSDQQQEKRGFRDSAQIVAIQASLQSEARKTKIQIPSHLLISHVTLGRIITFSRPPFVAFQ